MPNLDLIPVPLYNALYPYHVDYDNLPLQALITRIGVVNDAVDIVSSDIANSVGSQPNLATRLSQSLHDDGTLKISAIDNAMHHIGYHQDGLGPDHVEYVRMMLDERDKLALIADEATNFVLEVQTPISNIIVFNQGPVLLEPSVGISWIVTPPNKVSAELAFPIEAAHRHYYDIQPQYATLPADFQTYKTGSSIRYVEGSLRVYINGVRLSSSGYIYVPSFNITAPWTLNSFTPSADFLGFTLQNAITINDTIRIDFDISLV